MTCHFVDVPPDIRIDIDVPAGGTGKHIAGVDLAFLTERVQTCAMILGDDYAKRAISLQPKAAEWNFARQVDYSALHSFKASRFADDRLSVSGGYVLAGDRMIWQTDAKPLFDFCHVAKYWETYKTWAKEITISAESMEWSHNVNSISVSTPFLAFRKDRDTITGVDKGYYWRDGETRGMWFGAEHSTPPQYEDFVARYGRVKLSFTWGAHNKLGEISGGDCGGGGELYFNIDSAAGGFYSINLQTLRIRDFINAETMQHSTFGGLPNWVVGQNMDYWGTFEINGRTYTADGGEVSLSIVAEFQMGVEFPERLICGNVPD